MPAVIPLLGTVFVALGGADGVGATGGLCPPVSLSFSRRLFGARPELSFKPRFVALIRIWCLDIVGQDTSLIHIARRAYLVRVLPHWCTTQSHSISPVVPTDLLSSASFLRRSVSSSDQAPTAPAVEPVEIGGADGGAVVVDVDAC